jgi:exopolysaccharide biosynthesis polyprenyl glycosylphosphotransferase
MCRAIETPVAVALLLTVFILSNVSRFPNGFHDFLGLRITVKNLLLVSGFVLTWRLTAGFLSLYTWDQIRLRKAEAIRVWTLCTIVSAGALVFPAISVTGAFRYSTVLWFWVLSIPMLLALRALLRSVSASNVAPVREVLIVGSGPRALSVYQRLEEDSEQRHVVGFVDAPEAPTSDLLRRRMLGSLSELEGLLMHRAIDEVLIALPMKSCYNEIQEAIQVCQRVGVRARYLADLFHQSLPAHGARTESLAVVDIPVAADDYRLLIKRGIDVLGSSIGLVVLSPLFLLAGLAIKLTSAGPVFFAQERYGYNRRRFRMFKFRTMVQNAEQLQHLYEEQNEKQGPIFKIARDPRITPVGAFLRRTSIDELPQLANVLFGDMSLVGPRPLAIRDVQRFTEAALMRRFSVRPGITCIWQVSGRSNLTFDDWIELDLRYIDQWSLGLDLQILARTVPAVVKGTGAA